MPVLTILFGLGLIAIGTGTYLGAGEVGRFSDFVLHLILGLAAIGFGVGSLVKKPLRMHLMHGAVLLATLGVIVPGVLFAIHLYNLPTEDQMNILRALLTVILSGVYVYAAVRSFRAARRDRKNQPAEAPQSVPDEVEPTESI